MGVDWEIEVIESRETAYNLTVIIPYGAGKGRKNARKNYYICIISQGPLYRWGFAMADSHLWSLRWNDKKPLDSPLSTLNSPLSTLIEVFYFLFAIWSRAELWARRWSSSFTLSRGGWRLQADLRRTFSQSTYSLFYNNRVGGKH